MTQGGHVAYGESRGGAQHHPLDMFFRPSSVAVVGASGKPGSVGRTVFWNLLNSPFGGTVFPVNPRHRQVLGIRTIPKICDAGEPLDLAVVITPADTVPGVLDDCIAAGVRGVVIVSAGFTERGEPGRALEDQIRARVRESGIRVIGPNSLGVMNPVTGLNAAYAAGAALRGSVGFISQSGAISAAVLDWSRAVNTGFSAFVSCGAMVDVRWSDLIHYLGSDPSTKSIMLYMESLGDARSFLSAAREVAQTKPIIVYKAGQTEAGARAAATSGYSSADTCSDAVLSAALQRCGVVRVDDVETLFSMADALGKQPRPAGPRLAIVSNAAGPGVLATDALVNAGGDLAVLAPETMRKLNGILPGYWNRANPVDIVADAGPDRYARAVEAAAEDPNTDGVLVILTPQALADPAGTAEAVGDLRCAAGKPLLASWMGGATVAGGVRALNDRQVPTFAYPDAAARIFAAMWRHSYALRGLYETPQAVRAPGEPGGAARANDLIARALREGRVTLTDAESKELLACHGIPVAETLVAHDAAEAVRCAEALGYPVAMRLNGAPRSCELRPAAMREKGRMNAAEVRAAFASLMAGAPPGYADGVSMRVEMRGRGYQAVLGSGVDPQFGPYLWFGAGGSMAAVLRDRAIALPPINSTLARRTMERTRIHRAMRGAAGSVAVDTAPLERLLVCFGDLVAGMPRIREIEINPLFAATDGAPPRALDARVVLHGPETPDDALPQPVIRPYPAALVSSAVLRDGTEIVMRPIRPEDEGAMVRFHETLSSETIYFRYLRLLSLDQRIRHDRLTQLCFIDYDRQIGMVAVRDNNGVEEIAAISRLVKLHGTGDADFALVVGDRWQGRGLGGAMLRNLLDVARAEGVRRVVGVIHPENNAMIRLCKNTGFTLTKPVGEEVQAVFETAP